MAGEASGTVALLLGSVLAFYMAYDPYNNSMSSVENSTYPRVPWKTTDVVAGALLVILGAFALVVVVVILFEGLDAESALALNASIGAFSGILLLTSWALGPLKYRVPLRALGLRSSASKGVAQFGLPLLVLLASLAFTGVYLIIASQLGWDILDPPELPFEPDFSPVSLAIAGVLVIGIGPLSEEVFFRGFALPGLARRLGPVGALMGSSLLFAIAHGSVALLIPVFFTGMLLAWLYLRTGSLLGCCLAHSAQNALAFAAAISA